MHPSGSVRSKRRVLRGNVTPKGYHQVCLSKNKKVTFHYVHRLVAKAFLNNKEEKPEVNHVDENKLNNKVENLEWCTSSENAYHSAHMVSGDKSGRSKLKESDIPTIVKLIDSGVDLNLIAKNYKVGRGAIWKISKGVNWNWLTNRRELCSA